MSTGSKLVCVLGVALLSNACSSGRAWTGSPPSPDGKEPVGIEVQEIIGGTNTSNQAWPWSVRVDLDGASHVGAL
jgi:hypothetical protein